MQIKITDASEEQKKKRSRGRLTFDSSIDREWRISDEIVFIDRIGKHWREFACNRLPWQVNKLQWLIRYRNCLTLRNDFGKLNKDEVIRYTDDRINHEAQKLNIISDLTIKKMIADDMETIKRMEK